MSAAARYVGIRAEIHKPAALSRAECEECGWHGRSYRYRGSAEADATHHNKRKHPAPKSTDSETGAQRD